MSSNVVITGLGVVSSFGVGIGQFWSGLMAGHTTIVPLADFSGKNGQAFLGATVPDFDPNDYFPADDLLLLDRFSQFAVLAAREALEDAGLLAGSAAVSSAGAVIGTGCGGKQTDEESYVRLYKESRSRVHPLTIPKGMPSAAASMVSQHLGITGPVFSVASACASAAHAVTQGKLLIQSGLIDVALVGGADAPFTHGLLKAWDALRVVSNDTCRPFSRDRSGMVLGEGGGILVLESEKHARDRGARIYAEIMGCGLSSDAGHITRPDVTGISRAMNAALDDSGLEKHAIDYVNAHGTGTQANDRVETDALHRVFGDHAHSLVISSTKSMHGHALGAASALELIVTALSLYNAVVPPTANFTEAGEGCDLDYVPNEAREKDIRFAMSNSFAFGGLNAAIVLKHWSE